MLCTDPYVTVDDDLVPLDVVLEQADLLVIGAPHRAYADLAPHGARVRHLGRRPPGATGVSLRVSVVVPVYNEGEEINGFLDRLFDWITHAVRGPRRLRLARRHHRPAPREVRRRGPPARPHAQHLRPGRGAAPSATASTTPSADIIVVTMADGSDDPQQVERPGPPGRARRRRRRRLPLRQGRPAGRRPVRQADHVPLRRPVALLVRPGRHPRRHQLLQGLRPRLRPRGRHRVRHRLRARPRDGGQGPPPPPARRRAPHHLARPHGRRQSNFQVWSWLPRYLRWYRYAFGPRLS